jgi:hypothetical protein
VLVVELMDRVDVLGVPDDTVTLAGFREIVGPVGETVAVRLTVPLKPFWLEMVIVEVLDEPWTYESDIGLDESEKFGFGGAWMMKLPTIDG